MRNLTQVTGTEIANRLKDFLLGVHDKGAVLRDGLIEWLAGDEQDLCIGAGMDAHTIGFRRIFENRHALYGYALACDADFAAIHIHEHIMISRQGVLELRALRQMHIQIQRRGAFPADSAGNPVAGTGDNRDAHPRRGDKLWQGRIGKILLPRGLHFVAAGQIQPELETLHHTIFLLRNFGMNDPSPGRHPLHATVF